MASDFYLFIFTSLKVRNTSSNRPSCIFYPKALGENSTEHSLWPHPACYLRVISPANTNNCHFRVENEVYYLFFFQACSLSHHSDSEWASSLLWTCDWKDTLKRVHLNLGKIQTWLRYRNLAKALIQLLGIYCDCHT